MPNPTLPPTPGSSTDIRGKTQLSTVAPALSLGPPAGHETSDRASTTSSTPSNNGSDSSYHPNSPRSPVTGKRKQPGSQPQQTTMTDKDQFALPPPPSRSRKIIQMKPKASSSSQQKSEPQPQPSIQEEDVQEEAGAAASTGKGSGRKRGAKGNQNAAGRKIARKTAHSLIERRRRSKMNEEFGVLKDMIPACRGQEMHKLAILQASIDYLQYLERCVTDLKKNNTDAMPQPPPTRRQEYTDPADDNDQDEEMIDHSPIQATPTSSAQTTRPSTSQATHHTLPSIHSLPSLSQMTSYQPSSTHPSPSLYPTDSTSRHRFSVSSSTAGSAQHPSSSYSPYPHPASRTSASSRPGSTAASPLFTPHANPPLSHNLTGMASDIQGFSLASPALRPLDSGSHHSSEGQHTPSSATAVGGGSGRDRAERQERSDREAMAALLMLNSHDRRGSVGWRDGNGNGKVGGEGEVSAGSRGGSGSASASGSGSGAMSVKDLLSH